jgi:hypothetical protein
MSVRVSWLPSDDSNIASYDIERAFSVAGPWTFVANVLHVVAGPNWDAPTTSFFYTDNSGVGSSWYRLTAIDALAQRSPTSDPFQAHGGQPQPGVPNLVNTITIQAGDVATLLSLGFTSIEVWRSNDSGGTWVELTATPGVRLNLVEGTSLYNYYDTTGYKTSRYKWRFSANGAAPFSTYSQNVDGRPLPIAGALLSLGMARFVGVDGRPLKKTIIVAHEGDQVVAGYTVDSDTMTFSSDENGVVQVPLIQGARIRVAVEGTRIVRIITVPATDSFDLMEALSDAPDMFTVQTVAPMLTRRNI